MDREIREALRIILRSHSPAEAVELLLGELREIDVPAGIKAADASNIAAQVRLGKMRFSEAQSALEARRQVEIDKHALPEYVEEARAEVKKAAVDGETSVLFYVSPPYRHGVAEALEADGFKVAEGSNGLNISW